MEAVPGQEVMLPELNDFSGGAQITEDGQGGAIIQALQEMAGAEVVTEPYNHNVNLAEVLDESVLREMSSELIQNFEDDKESRSDWEEGYTKGLDLLGVRYEERTQPFQGASGVTHPLIAESVTQFQAQSYKELLPSGGPVKTQIIGAETPERDAQSIRVKNFMNYMITEVMEEFDPDTDQMLFYLPLSGSTFKKVYFDETKQRPVSRFIAAEDLVIPYTATDLASASRITHVLRMDTNQIRKLQIAGVYRDVDLSYEYEESTDTVKEKVRELEGIDTNINEELHTVLEMHVDLDVEGFEDIGPTGEPTGVKLPYIVTIDQGSGNILSLRRNYAEGDPLKRKIPYFVHYKFLPGLGFYGFGLIHMIGGLGKAATSILRQLIDAGTLANLPAGFKARGIRIRNDDEPLSPGEFRDIDAPGGDIRNSIIPLPFKEPSATLAQLLGVLIESGRRFVSIADNQIASPGSQQQPVGTTVALLERGMKVMSAIHKRLHYAQKIEFRMLAYVIRDNMPAVYPYEVPGAQQEVMAADFDDRIDILPVSDPNIFSMAQRVTLAQTQLQLAQSNPQMHNVYEAYKRMYQALEVQNIDQILPPPPPPPEPQPEDPAFENAKAAKGAPIQPFPQQDHDAHIATHMAFYRLPIVQAAPQVQAELLAHMFHHISQKARNIVDQEIQALQQQNAQVQLAVQVGAIDPMVAEQQIQRQAAMIDPTATDARVAQLEAQFTAELMQMINPEGAEQDPLVAIRQQELAIKAAESERKAQIDRERMTLEEEKLRQRAATDAARIESQEDIAEQRADVNMERINLQRQSMMQRQT
jgi:hypothetical protein